MAKLLKNNKDFIIAFMQGRFSVPVGSNFQYFPIHEWEKELIRAKKIGFNNILITDDLSMKALQNSVGNNAISALQAGCDVVLHCNGNMLEMQEINQVLPNISSELKHKLLT